MDIHGLAHGDDPCIECKDIDQEPQEDSGGAMVTCSGYTTHFWVGFWMMITTWAVNMPLRNFLIGTSRGGCALFKKLGSCASATEHVLNRTWMADAGVKMKKKCGQRQTLLGIQKPVTFASASSFLIKYNPHFVLDLYTLDSFFNHAPCRMPDNPNDMLAQMARLIGNGVGIPS